MGNTKIYNISDISETMLLPLYCRALESESKKPIIKDNKSVEIVNKLNNEFSKSERKFYKNLAQGKLHKQMVVTISLRTKKYDEYVLNFLKQFPDGIVVNIGCGLDTRFERIDNGEVEWYDLDFPEVLKLKRQFFQENERYHFISSSALNFNWIDALSEKKNRPFFFIAEGVFMYLYKEQVKSLLLKLQSVFPRAELACEVANEYIVKMLHSGLGKGSFQRKFHLNKDATFHFGIKESNHFEKWNPKIQFLDEWTYFDESEKKLGWMRFLGNIKLFRYAQWTVHYKLNETF